MSVVDGVIVVVRHNLDGGMDSTFRPNPLGELVQMLQRPARFAMTRSHRVAIEAVTLEASPSSLISDAAGEVPSP